MKATLGTKIATLRKEKGLKQDDLAQMLNVSAQAVSKWENGTTQPSAAQFIALCDILGVYDVVGEFSGKKSGSGSR